MIRRSLRDLIIIEELDDTNSNSSGLEEVRNGSGVTGAAGGLFERCSARGGGGGRGLGGCALGVLLSRGMGWRWVSRVAFRGEVHGGDLDFACSRLSRYEGSLLGSVGRAMES